MYCSSAAAAAAAAADDDDDDNENDGGVGVQLEASYRDCCEDRDMARQELDKLKISLRTLEDSKLQCDQQISSLSSQVSSVLSELCF